MNNYNRKSYCSDISAATGKRIDADYTLEEANIRIDNYDLIYAKAIVNEQVKGTFTLLNAIDSEIDINQIKVRNSKELGFGNSVRFGTHCINILNELKKEITGAHEANRAVNPLDFIEPVYQDWFLKIENKAFTEIKESKIRCAAFCEMLYNKNIITNTKKWQKTLNDFSKSRYSIDIEVSLKTKNNATREKHVNHTVNGKPPLKNYLQ
jgi:hypothetical protein